MKRYGVYVALVMSAFAGCTTVHLQADGTAVVPRFAEVRSPFGTNVGYVKLERCERMEHAEEGIQPLFPDADGWVNCTTVKDWALVSSQGQGGQIVQGALMGAGMGLMGLSMPAQNVTVTGSSATSSATAAGGSGGGVLNAVIIGGGHK